MAELLDWARSNPGRFTYPKPPQFHGTTFLKQVLIEAGADRGRSTRPYAPSAFAARTAPLWAALDALHPHLWRQGKQFPASNTVMRQMLADGELAICADLQPQRSRQRDRRQGAAGHRGAATSTRAARSATRTSWPSRSTRRAKEGAQVAANFLLSPPAQARKADIRHWGDPTVLALDKLRRRRARAVRGRRGARPGHASRRRRCPSRTAAGSIRSSANGRAATGRPLSRSVRARPARALALALRRAVGLRCSRCRSPLALPLALGAGRRCRRLARAAGRPADCRARWRCRSAARSPAPRSRWRRAWPRHAPARHAGCGSAWRARWRRCWRCRTRRSRSAWRCW